MQPVLATGGAAGVTVAGKDGTKRQTTVNSASFWNLKPEQVAAEDVFFHQYFAQVGKPAQAARAKKAKAGDAGSDDEEEEAEGEIWDALVNSRSDIQGDDDGGSDFDMDDMDDDDISLDLESDDGASDDDDDDDGGADLGSDVPSGDEGGFEGIFGDSDDSDAEAESEGEDTATAPAKGKGRLNRKEMRSLPMFASADDYAEMLAGEEDGMDE